MFISTHAIVDLSLVPSYITRSRNWESFTLNNMIALPSDCRLYNTFLEFLQVAALAAAVAAAQVVVAVPLLPMSAQRNPRLISVMARVCVINASGNESEKPSDINIVQPLHDISLLQIIVPCFLFAIIFIQLKAIIHFATLLHAFQRLDTDQSQSISKGCLCTPKKKHTGFS